MVLNYVAAQRAIDRGAERGLELASEHLLGVANDLVPIEEGDLMRSGQAKVHNPGIATVSYGGNGLDDYAVRQHEELTWRHDPGRQAKYLEAPLASEAAVMLAIIGTQVRRALK